MSAAAHDLIVDFPARGRSRVRCHRDDDGLAVPILPEPPTARLLLAKKKHKKSLSFDQTIDIQFFQRRDDETKEGAWYSERDYKAFKAANRRAVFEAHAKFRSTTSSSSVVDASLQESFADCTLTGLERILTPKVLKKSQACKAGCWRAVLGEQDRQDDEGVQDPIRIALASLRETGWAAKRAHTIGMLNAQL